jgi:hypothetical protein
MRYECHPWPLDPGSPCRDDGFGVFSVYKACVYRYFLLFTHYDSHRANIGINKMLVHLAFASSRSNL